MDIGGDLIHGLFRCQQMTESPINESSKYSSSLFQKLVHPKNQLEFHILLPKSLHHMMYSVTVYEFLLENLGIWSNASCDHEDVNSTSASPPDTDTNMIFASETLSSLGPNDDSLTFGRHWDYSSDVVTWAKRRQFDITADCYHRATNILHASIFVPQFSGGSSDDTSGGSGRIRVSAWRQIIILSFCGCTFLFEFHFCHGTSQIDYGRGFSGV